MVPIFYLGLILMVACLPFRHSCVDSGKRESVRPEVKLYRQHWSDSAITAPTSLHRSVRTCACKPPVRQYSSVPSLKTVNTTLVIRSGISVEWIPTFDVPLPSDPRVDGLFTMFMDFYFEPNQARSLVLWLRTATFWNRFRFQLGID